MVLKWRDIYIKNIRVVSVMASLKMEGTVIEGHVKLQRPLFVYFKSNRNYQYWVYVITSKP